MNGRMRHIQPQLSGLLPERRPVMNKIRNILAVCRMTSHCRPVVKAAAAQARLFNARLYVLHVVHDPFGLEGWNLPMPSLAEEYQQLMIRTREELSERVQEVKEQGLPVDEIIREGRPVHEIMKVILEEKIDLLVLPAHEESRLEHFLFGGDNEELIRAMPCSILLIKREPKRLDDEKRPRQYHPALATWKK
jgi:nucleotide-binding universal stress UspA family protein